MATTTTTTTPMTTYFNAPITPSKHPNKPLKRYGPNKPSNC
ncbi:MAG: hypothetical protein RXN86_04740 [Vulcanisaeta sp.]